MKYQARIKDRQFDIEWSNDLSENELSSFEISGPNSCRGKWKGKIVDADLVSLDKSAKRIVLRIQGRKIQIHLKEPIEQLIEQWGIRQKPVVLQKVLKAPMPGLVLHILAEPEKEYKAGEPLLILEAMKMENVYKAPADVRIKNIRVQEKQSVEKGEVLIEFHG